MTTVPKLNYANLRGKSKDNQYSQRKLQNTSSELFSHMNQDNLKYIQSQIKQKTRKTNTFQIKIKSEEQEKQDESPHVYDEKIQQRSSKYQQTQRESSPPIQPSHLKVLKTDGESVKYDLSNQQGPEKISQEAQTHKLSYYDLVSQAKSKRVSSIEGYYQQENRYNSINKQSGQFLTFLSGYIDDLKSKQKKAKDQKQTKSKNKQLQKSKSISVSSVSQSQIIKQAFARQKLISLNLSKQNQFLQTKMHQSQMRISSLQKIVYMLVEKVEHLTMNSQINRGPPPLQQTQLQNLNIYSHNHPQFNKPSHRNSNASFSYVSKQHPKQIHSNNNTLNELDRKRFLNNPKNPQGYMSIRNSRKAYHQQIDNLQKQFSKFIQTGECEVRAGNKLYG